MSISVLTANLVSEVAELLAERDNLRAALQKVLDAHEKEAKAEMSYQNACENFSDSVNERKAFEQALLAVADSEQEARSLLDTLHLKPKDSVNISIVNTIDSSMLLSQLVCSSEGERTVLSVLLRGEANPPPQRQP